MQKRIVIVNIVLGKELWKRLGGNNLAKHWIPDLHVTRFKLHQIGVDCIDDFDKLPDTRMD